LGEKQWNSLQGVIVDAKHDLPIIGQIEEIFVADSIRIFLKITHTLSHTTVLIY